MEKFKDFPDAIRQLLGCEIETVGVNSILERVKKTNMRKSIESFLLAAYCYKKYPEDLNEEFKEVIERITGCELTDDVFKKVKAFLADSPSSDTQGRYSSILHNENDLFDDYEAVIAFYICSIGTMTAQNCLFLCELHVKNINKKRSQFIKDLIAFHAVLGCTKFTLWHLFKKTCTDYIEKKISDVSAITHLSHKLIEIQQSDITLCFYWFYSYLGESNIAECIFSVLTEEYGTDVNLRMPFSEEFFWNNYELVHLKQKYESVLTAISEGKKGKQVSDLLEENKIFSLIPLALYAKELGNIEAESYFLWYAMRKTRSVKLLQRMEEISGYEIPLEFRKASLEARPNWLTNRIEESFKVLNSTNPVSYLNSMKKLYTVRPFTLEALKALLKINMMCDDKDVAQMIQFSVSRISSGVVLGKLLSYAITAKNERALGLILSRLAMLNNCQAILYSVEICSKYLAIYDTKGHDLARQAVDFYREFEEKERLDLGRCSRLDALHVHRQTKMKTIFSSLAKEEIIAQKRALEMLERKQYKELFKMLKGSSSFSVEILELILKAAIADRSASNVVFAYTLLVEKNSAYASFYNVVVEPYFLQQRISKETSRVGTSNLISRVWGRPAVLENPVDMKTRRITWKEPKFRY